MEQGDGREFRLISLAFIAQDVNRGILWVLLGLFNVLYETKDHSKGSKGIQKLSVTVIYAN